MANIKKTTGQSLGALVSKFPRAQRAVIDSIIENIRNGGKSSKDTWYFTEAAEFPTLVNNFVKLHEEYSVEEIYIQNDMLINPNVDWVQDNLAERPSLKFTNLKKISGFVEIDYTQPDSINPLYEMFPALEVIEGIFEIYEIEDTVVSLPSLKEVSALEEAGIYLSEGDNATDVVFPNLETVSGGEEFGFYIEAYSSLTNISTPKLTRIKNAGMAVPLYDMDGAGFVLSDLSILSNLDWPIYLLTKVIVDSNMMMYVQMDNLPSISESTINSFLSTVAPSMSYNKGIEFTFMSSITNFNLGPISNIGKMTLQFNNNMTSASLSSLVSVTERVIISNNALLTNVDISSLSSTHRIYVGYNPLLTSINVSGSLTVGDNTFIYFWNNALDQASVDSILAALNAGGTSGTTINISGGTNSAPTGGATNADKLALEARGCTVIINL